MVIDMLKIPGINKIIDELRTRIPPVETPSLIIYKDGDNYYIKDGLTGQIELYGTDASTVIQQAIDAVSNAGGGRIFIKKGTYNIETSIKPKSNVIIEAEDSTGTIFNLTQPFIFQGLGEPSVENFAIINGRFIIKANVRVMWLRETARNILIKGCRLEIDPNIGTYAPSFGMRFEKADNVVIDSVTILGAGSDTIHLTGSKIAVINSYLDGMLAFANGIYASSVTNLFVYNSVFIGWKHNGIMLSGVSSRVVIAGNYFYNCADGVDHDGNVDHEVIAYNVFHDCGTGGDGSISLTPISPNKVSSVIIIGNIFRGENAGMYGVHIASSENVIVEANVYMNGGGASFFIRIYNSRYVNVKNNVAYMPGYGVILPSGPIQVIDSQNVRLEDNIIIGGPDDRNPIIRIASSDVGATSWVFIRRNYLRPNLYGNPTRESSGIVFADLNATNIYIEENRFDFGLNDKLIVNPPPGTVIRRNIGYPTEASGVATIVAGSTRVTVSHGLATAPSKVLVTPYANIRAWVENITGTSFDIATDIAPTVDVNVAWYAEI